MPLRIVFLGSDPIALPLLNALVGKDPARVEVVGVFTQPDRPVGRGQQVGANAIKQWAQARGLPVHQPLKLTEVARQELAALRPDVSLVMAYGHILKDDFIATPTHGTLNLHTSILPRYRGASPIQSAIAHGDRETGVTLMRIVRELDAGPVAAVERVAIDPLDTALELEAKLAAVAPRLVLPRLEALAAGTLPFVPQEHAAATFCRRLTKADGALDFSAPAATLAARINGLFPWPSCSFELAGLTVKIGLADALEDEVPVGDVGEVLGADAAGLLIRCGAGVLRCRRLQRPGGRMLPAGEFLRGQPVPPGTRLLSRPMPILVAAHPLR